MKQPAPKQVVADYVHFEFTDDFYYRTKNSTLHYKAGHKGPVKTDCANQAKQAGKGRRIEETDQSN
jgi:hypothetical protein